jgi:hypothetical protein
MCKHGISIEMPVQVWINQPNFPEQFELKNRYIDACIAPDIYKLNNNGCVTLNCCCGHRQDTRFNIDHSCDVNNFAGILITNESIRHAESLGYQFRTIAEATEVTKEGN